MSTMENMLKGIDMDGKMTFANGNMYEGEFKDDMKHGEGKFTYANGDVYEGDYADDEAHGKGKITSRR